MILEQITEAELKETVRTIVKCGTHEKAGEVLHLTRDGVMGRVRTIRKRYNINPLRMVRMNVLTDEGEAWLNESP